MSKAPLALPLLFCNLRSNDDGLHACYVCFHLFCWKRLEWDCFESANSHADYYFFFIRSNIYRVLYGNKADKGLLETDGANWSDDRAENGSHATAVGYEIEQEMTET